jgi:hypothetical protein
MASGAFTQTLGEQSLEQGRGAPHVPDLAQTSTNQQTISLSEPKHGHRAKQDWQAATTVWEERSRGCIQGEEQGCHGGLLQGGEELVGGS